MHTVIVKERRGGRSLKQRKEFFSREIVDGLRGRIPGEWVYVRGSESKEVQFLAMANPLVENGPCLRVLDFFTQGQNIPKEIDEDYAKSFICRKLKEAYALRKAFQLTSGARIFYGEFDGLPGVQCDLYQNCGLLQINTAGLDRYRDFMRSEIKEMTNKEIFILDNPEYRKDEGLPIYPAAKALVHHIEVEEDQLSFHLPLSDIQKVGYYYDHRINRLKLAKWMNTYQFSFQRGVDLFCYQGSWGLQAIKAGLENCDFVDQGNYSSLLQENLKRNGFAEKGTFYREDVFEFLSKNKKEYDLVISDPPAFAKSFKNKARALGGYEKLHRLLGPLCRPGALLAIGSCTHGISLEELDATVQEGLSFSGKRGQLIDMGTQGPDHPISSFQDKGFYIKFLLYRIN